MMRSRADSSRRGPLRVQALYSVGALARAGNVSPDMLLRLLRASKVELVRSGRAVLVPLHEIEEKIPALWKSIELAERLRHAGS
jgi:hypothetical protein